MADTSVSASEMIPEERKVIKAATAALAALLLLCLAACGATSGPSYFVTASARQVLLVQWQTPQNGQASGSVTQVQPSGTAPDQTLGVTTVPVDVTIDGSQVTLRPTGLYELFGGTSITATVGNGGLTITLPPDSSSGDISTGTLSHASASAYNADVAALRRSIRQGNAQALAQQQAQAQQSANTAAEQAAQGDLGTLQQDASFGSDLSSLASDVQQANSDLGSERSDAAAGQGSYCDNVYTVGDDAYTLDDDGYSISDDVSTLTGDISTARQDIRTAHNDLAALSASGLPAPSNAAAAVSAARQAIRHAIAVANGDIAAGDQDDRTAYAIGNGLATGSCQGQGPGSPSGLNPLIK